MGLDPMPRPGRACSGYVWCYGYLYLLYGTHPWLIHGSIHADAEVRCTLRTTDYGGCHNLETRRHVQRMASWHMQHMAYGGLLLVRLSYTHMRASSCSSSLEIELSELAWLSGASLLRAQ